MTSKQNVMDKPNNNDQRSPQSVLNKYWYNQYFQTHTVSNFQKKQNYILKTFPDPGNALKTIIITVAWCNMVTVPDLQITPLHMSTIELVLVAVNHQLIQLSTGLLTPCFKSTNKFCYFLISLVQCSNLWHAFMKTIYLNVGTGGEFWYQILQWIDATKFLHP